MKIIFIKDSLGKGLLALTLMGMLLLFALPFAASQEGEPFMNHIKPENVAGAKITSITEDIENTMVFAGNTGVITFDSEEWQLLTVPNIPMVVQADSLLPMVYVGGRGFYGYLMKSGDGIYAYHDLGKEGVESGDITHIFLTEQHIVYYGKDLIAMADRKILYNAWRYRPDSLTVFSGLFIYDDKPFVNVLEVGLHELSDRNIIRKRSQIDFSGSEILFGLAYGDNDVLLGTDKNRLYRYDGQNFHSISLEDQEYITESYLEGAVWLEEDIFALSTVLGGCLIIDATSGKTLNTLNYQTGLPDDEIYAIAKDQNQGLWIAHQYGLTRVDVSLPVRAYGNYPGLSGNLTAVTMLRNTLYVSTNEGVFFLEEKKDFVTEEIVVKVETPSTVQLKVAEPNISEELITRPVHRQQSPRELRRQQRQAKKDSIEQQQDSIAGESTPVEEKDQGESVVPTDDPPREQQTGDGTATGDDILVYAPRTRARSIKQKIYSLQSISHEFTRLGRFEEKVKDLVPIGNRIIIASNEGLYEVVNKQLKTIRRGWYIEHIFPSPDPSRMYVITDETAYSMVLRNNVWRTETNFSYIGQEIYSVCESGDSVIWLGCDNRAYQITSVPDSQPRIKAIDFHEDYYDPVFLRNVHDTIHFFLSNGIYFYADDSLQRTIYISSNVKPQFFFSDGSITWAKAGNTWISLENQENYNKRIDSYLNLFENITDLFLDPEGNAWVVHEDRYLYKINSADVDQYRSGFQLFLKSVYDDKGYYPLDQLQFDYLDRSLVFNFSAPFYLKDHSTSYQYFVEGMSAGWSSWNNSPALSFPVLPVGKFTLHVKARNILNQSSTLKSYPIVITPPWWLSWLFITLVVLILVIIVIQIIRWRVRILQRDKQILEQKVLERTAEIQRQKDEIAEQKKEIMDSIYYARRIQKAVLPDDHLANKNMPEHFVLYLPRDIVSGDFYWIAEKDDKTLFAAADCTGHGVPGAFMSMLGMSYLKEIVNKSKRLSSARILDRLRNHVKATLSQSTKGGQQDGMDIALCILDKDRKSLQYSGAFNPLYLIRNGGLSEYKPDLMPIGIYIRKEKPFKNHNIKTVKGDCYYIFSDGYQDQFGGETRKKFLARSFKKLLLSIHNKPMPEQREILYETLKQWMEGYEQVDDILVVGFRI
ncbi:MAG: SpoIIE family protein phosphatase [Bacteroidales bacterium]|nr:SpoIIE family protein phosphatase [Bacteroidales bacterium]